MTTTKKAPAAKEPQRAQPGGNAKTKAASGEAERVEETPFEAVASICGVLVAGLFVLTFLAQNFVIPSGSMEKTLLVGDHLVVDRINMAPPTKWMPLMKYREPRRGDVVVFIKPSPEPQPDAEGNPQYFFLVKRLIGVPGDHIHLDNGVVIINGVAQSNPYAQPTTPQNFNEFLDQFPSVPVSEEVPYGATEDWALNFPSHVVDGNLVVPPGEYFMMGDNRHDSLDSRFWGFVPRQAIVGRPLVIYFSLADASPRVEPQNAQAVTQAADDRLGHERELAAKIAGLARWQRIFRVVR
jgi:signal peptidase I